MEAWTLSLDVYVFMDIYSAKISKMVKGHGEQMDEEKNQ